MNTILVLTAVLLAGNESTSSQVTLQQPLIVSPVSHTIEYEASGSGLIKVATTNNENAKRSEVQQSFSQSLAQPTSVSSRFSNAQTVSFDTIIEPQAVIYSEDVSPIIEPITNSEYEVVSGQISTVECGCDTCVETCDSCNSCSSCDGCGHGHLRFSFWGKHCLPDTHHAPGNMSQHFPYEAFPKTYYYYRPYNMLHIPNQQAHAVSNGANPQQPYSNAVFADIYAELEAELDN